MESLLEARHITKTFSGITALQDVSLKLEAGKVLALIGENGAGKSTLLKVMSGVHTDYEGSIHFKGSTVQFANPKDAQEKGITIIHQELNLIPNLSIAENIFLGRELTNRFGFIDRPTMNARTRELLSRLKLEVEPDQPVKSLKVGQQQVVEIAKALLVDAAVVFMDEPTSAIGESEVEMLFQIVRQLKEEGKSIVYISHKLEELYEIADDYAVLRDGCLVGAGQMKDIKRPELINLMAGREIKINKKRTRQLTSAPCLKLEGVSVRNPDNPARMLIQDVTFELRKGEVLGIYGLMGAGRTELCETLFGLHKVVAGQLFLDGRPLSFSNPSQAIAAGIALVPEDRKQNGIFPGLSVSNNLSLTVLNNITRQGLLNKAAEAELYQLHQEALNIKANSGQQLIKNLSGGNQQKVVLAKWIACNPKVLLLDEPTRGIDVNAKNEIYELIGRLSDKGISIIVVSSEIPEILTVADRILVMAEGRITAAFSSSEVTENKLVDAGIPERIA